MDSLQRRLFVSLRSAELPVINNSQEWHQQWAKDNLPKLTTPQEVTNAGILTHALVRGIINTYSESDHPYTDNGLSRLFIINPKKRISRLAVASVWHNEIYIYEQALLKDSQIDPFKEIVLKSPTENDSYGSLQEYYELVGAEEMHHNLHPELYSEYLKPPTTLAEHDSHPAELLALEWKMQYAKIHGFSQVTKKNLQRRYENTSEYIKELEGR